MRLKLRKSEHSKFADFLNISEGIRKGIEKNMIISQQKEIFLRKPYFLKKSQEKSHRKKIMMHPLKT